jgi:amidase
MDQRELAFAGVVGQAELVRRGEVSSRELVELSLERIERLDPELNAFRLVMPERALADAEAADAARATGEARPLLGVPVAVKDAEDVAGAPTRWGTDAFGAEPAAADSELVSRLRAAGAVVVGKTNLPELAIIGDTEGPAFGVTRNPWDTSRSPGGSSGGSAAAVAAGLVAAATASDGAGSIRIPAANCGLFGLKPQRDRIPLSPVEEHWNGLSVVGFETRTVADTALLLDVGAGSGRLHADAAARTPQRLRIAFTTRTPLPGPIHRSVRQALERTVEALRALGHEVDERTPAYGTATNALTARYLRGAADDARATPRPERLARRTRGFARMGSLVSDRALAWARGQEERHRERLGEVFRDHDVLLTPTTAQPPVKAAQWEGLGAPRTFMELARTYPYTALWNMTGQPACSLPAPVGDHGLPLGAQLVGRVGDEATLLSLAAQLEAELGWPQRRPPVS